MLNSRIKLVERLARLLYETNPYSLNCDDFDTLGEDVQDEYETQAKIVLDLFCESKLVKEQSAFVENDLQSVIEPYVEHYHSDDMRPLFNGVFAHPIQIGSNFCWVIDRIEDDSFVNGEYAETEVQATTLEGLMPKFVEE